MLQVSGQVLTNQSTLFQNSYLCSIIVVNDWIRTRVLRYRKQLRCQLYHYPGFSLVLSHPTPNWYCPFLVYNGKKIFPFQYRKEITFIVPSLPRNIPNQCQ